MEGRDVTSSETNGVINVRHQALSAAAAAVADNERSFARRASAR